MQKYKGIPYQHWQNLKLHYTEKKKKMAGTLHFIYKARLSQAMGVLDHYYGRSVDPKQVLKTQ